MKIGLVSTNQSTRKESAINNKKKDEEGDPFDEEEKSLDLHDLVASKTKKGFGASKIVLEKDDEKSKPLVDK